MNAVPRQRFPATETERSTAGPVVIRKATPADADAIVHSFNKTARVPQTAAYWRWKFCRADKVTSVIAVSGAGEVLAQFAEYPMRYWSLASGELVGGVGADIFAVRRPEVIAGKVFLQVLRYFMSPDVYLRDYAFSCGFPNEIAYGIYVRTYKMLYDVELTRYVRTFGWTDRRFRCAATHVLPNAEIDRLWNQIRAKYSFSAIRDAEWYRWRFVDHPIHSYRALAVFATTGHLRAWAMVRKIDGMLAVVDMTVDPDDHDGFVELQRQIVAAGLSLGCASAVMVLPDWFAERVGVVRSKWRPLPKDRRERMIIIDHDIMPFELGERPWYSFGDGDLY